MVQSFTEDFQVVWKDPADVLLHWDWDTLHSPRPLPPLARDLSNTINAAIFGSRNISLNGYMYSNGVNFPGPTPEVLERGVLEVWEKEYVPRIRELCIRLRSADYDSMSSVQLAESLDQMIADAGDGQLDTMVVVLGFFLPTNQLADFCEEQLGPDGAQVAATLLQGFDNVSAGGGAGLGKLAESAASLPHVAAAIREERYDDLESVAGGREFLGELQSYLDEYGWRVEGWGMMHIPTWAEDPRTPLMLIGRYLDDATLSPGVAIKRSIERRQEAAREIESKLSGEQLDRFKSLLEACQAHVSISEARAFWQLTLDGSLRVPLLSLGRKLVEAGVLGEPNDVFFLSMEELTEAAHDPSSSQRATIRHRKADLERWERLTPPPFVGAPPKEPDMPPAMQRAVSRFTGSGVKPSAEESVIKGNAASRGVVRGRARIIREIGEARRLQKGEILVCRSTAPPWTPLFAIASAVVTDSGGILSHSAICAREFGIPCVVGTQTATQQIADGAMITVDGGEGIVRIET
jgi:pyruvate,water dikinase